MTLVSWNRLNPWRFLLRIHRQRGANPTTLGPDAAKSNPDGHNSQKGLREGDRSGPDVDEGSHNSQMVCRDLGPSAAYVEPTIASLDPTRNNSQMGLQDLDRTCAELDSELHNSQKVLRKVDPIGGWLHAIWDNSQMVNPRMDGHVGEVPRPRS